VEECVQIAEAERHIAAFFLKIFVKPKESILGSVLACAGMLGNGMR
jgi:hypothetical protein